jgi:hypothetical protein
MTTDTALRIAQAAAELRRTHPKAPALAELDQLPQTEGVGNGLTFPALLLHPRSPMGQLIAEVFDHGMSPKEWCDWTGPEADPVLSAALMQTWSMHVLPRFTSRYGSKEAPFDTPRGSAAVHIRALAKSRRRHPRLAADPRGCPRGTVEEAHL